LSTKKERKRLVKAKPVFIDPSVVSPRELSSDEMNQIAGGAIPIAAVIWVTSCGEMLAGGVALAIATVVDKVD
jgi:lactobin A/cerein 7B family class IIb bacteriocin